MLDHGLENEEVELWPAGEQDDPDWRALHAEELRELAGLVARPPREWMPRASRRRPHPGCRKYRSHWNPRPPVGLDR